MPTSTALGCAQCPPTRMLSASTMTAQRQERNGSRPEMRFRPGIALIALLAGLVLARPGVLAGSSVRGPGRDHRAGGRQPLHAGWRSRGSTRSPISSMPRPSSACRTSRPRSRARSGASATRATAPPLSPIPRSTARNSAATTRSIVARGVTVAGNPRFWLVSGERLYLFGREENRDAFAADPAQRSTCGQRAKRWPESLRARIAWLASKAWRPASRRKLSVSRRRRIAPGDEFRHDEILPAPRRIAARRPAHP